MFASKGIILLCESEEIVRKVHDQQLCYFFPSVK